MLDTKPIPAISHSSEIAYLTISRNLSNATKCFICRTRVNCAILSNVEQLLSPSGGSSPEPGGMAPRWRPGNFFRLYINIITKPTAYDGPREY